jgi:5'-nucleotidase
MRGNVANHGGDGIMRNIYLDLDGVMADFDAHFPSVFGLDHKSMADDDMWKVINAHESYFLDMPICSGAYDFFLSIRHLNPIILTACPRTNYANAATQKRKWVRDNLCKNLTVLPVMGGHNKWLFMHSEGDVLIDDYEKNIKPWVKAGGIGIIHSDFYETSRVLSDVINP